MNARRWVNALALCAATLCSNPALAQAPDVSGYVSLLVDLFPSTGPAGDGTRAVVELRARTLLEASRDLGPVRVSASGFVEGLLASRERGAVRAAVVRPQELHAEWASGALDVRVGFSRLAWGRLDEVQPTDVINPIDVTRFFLEGRGEARMPVGVARVRWTPSERFRAEAVLVPIFRASRFDQLDEPSSPFNLGPRVSCTAVPGSGQCVTLDVERDEPDVVWSNVQGGGRFEITSGRVDWSTSVYRGFEPLPLYTATVVGLPSSGTSVRTMLDAEFPRFTMLGADFETTQGVWGLRGEAALFVSREIQRSSPLLLSTPGRTLDAGVGVDRRAGDYRFAGSVLFSRRWLEAGDAPDVDKSGVTLVGVADRSFARQTRTLRAVTLYDPADGTVFARSTIAWNLRDNWWVEGSGGIFLGQSAGVVGQLSSRDFVFLRLKVFY